MGPLVRNVCSGGRHGNLVRPFASSPPRSSDAPSFLPSSSQVWQAGIGESAVESHDNDWYRKTAKSRGRVFRNPYDLGWRENLRYFFNVGPGR
jgi:hypothetical protein